MHSDKRLLGQEHQCLVQCQLTIVPLWHLHPQHPHRRGATDSPGAVHHEVEHEQLSKASALLFVPAWRRVSSVEYSKHTEQPDLFIASALRPSCA